MQNESMSRPESYKDLEAWQKAVEFAVSVYRLSAKFPREERFELTKQLRRSAVSVAANIVVVCHQLGFLSYEEQQTARELAAEIGRLLAGIKRSLRRLPPRP